MTQRIRYGIPLIAMSALLPALAHAQAVSGHIALTGDSNAFNPTSAPWNQTYYWSTCGDPTHSCTNAYTLQLKAWPVYSQTAAQSNAAYSDFFLVQLTANLNMNGCWGFYTGDHSDRIAAYWLRQFNVSANVVPPSGGDAWSSNDLQIDLSYYNPKTANASTTVDQGVTWSISGSGTVGAKNNSAGFSAGVSFDNSHTTSFDALNIATDVAPANDPSYLGWTYDSWNYVHETIQPGNQACGGPGVNSLPSILTSTATATQTWIYEASPAVREAYADTGTLPIQIDFSVLLGYTFYGNTLGNCAGNDQTQTPIGTFPLHNLNNAYTVGSLSDTPSQGLAFDVSCGTTTQYGTIPLGDASSPDFSEGNPGTPLSMQTWTVEVPFAALEATSE